jgi:hypothetical protein
MTYDTWTTRKDVPTFKTISSKNNKTNTQQKTKISRNQGEIGYFAGETLSIYHLIQTRAVAETVVHMLI